MMQFPPNSAEPLETRHARTYLSERKSLALCVAALVVLIPLTFAPALTDYRLSDSFRLVGQIDFHVAFQYFHQTSGFGRNEYRPLVLLSYAWDNWIWHDRPFGYHLTSLALHTASSVLFLLVFYRLMGSLTLAFFTTVLFALNPAHHSRVAWIAARDSALCLFFLLIAWLGYLHRHRDAEPPGNAQDDHGRSRLWWAISGGAFALALLSYEGAVAFPFILLAMELIWSGEGRRWPARLVHALRAVLPFFVLLALYVGWWLALFHGQVGGYDLDLTVGGLARDFYRMHYRLFHHIQHWLGLGYLFAGWWVWRQRKSSGPWIWFSLALLWLGYLPFLAVRGYADRFGFLSAAGVALFLSLCAVPFLNSYPRRLTASAVLPVLFLLLLVGYYTQSTGRRLNQWLEAGQKADSMLAQLKALRPSFPPNATLVFDQVPPMHGNAHVFATGLRAAVRSRYAQEIPRISYSHTALEPSSKEELLSEEPVFHFRYLPEEGRLVEITTRPEVSSRRREPDRPDRTPQLGRE